MRFRNFSQSQFNFESWITISQLTQSEFEKEFAISQLTQFDFRSILQPCLKWFSICKSLFFQPFKAINKKGGKRVKSAKSKKVDVLTKESKRVFDEPKEEEINEEVQETKKDLFEDGDDDEGKLIIIL